MSKNYCPFLYGKFRKFFKIAAMAVTLSAAACAGSSDEAQEPIASEDGEFSDNMANDEGSGLIIEQETPDETGNDVPQLVEDVGMSDSQDMAGVDDAPVGEDTDAVPEEIMSSAIASEPETPESLDSTLDNQSMASDDSAMDDAVAAQPISDEYVESEQDTPSFADSQAAPSMASMGNFGQSSGILPPGVIASPGAAIFIKSKYEKSPSTASFSGGGSNSYVVVPGDTVSGISKKIYGSFDHWKKLASANGIKAPYVINPGDVIKYSADTAQAKSFVSGHTNTAGMKTVKVKHGDTLSKLAGELFGSIDAWKVLYDLNKGKISNPNHIHAGMVLAYSGSGFKATAKAKVNKAPAKKVVTAKVTPTAAPKVEKPVAAPVEEEVEAPVAEATVDQEPAVIEDDSDEVINVNLPVDDEE